jgi:proteasome accessory factor B
MFWHGVDVLQKVHTVSRKSERLVNLVIALLATKRYLTKSEIFRTIEGYEGSSESMERMFERDKDELRALGIEIEVSALDPLFDDEIGYRIRFENYVMDHSGFTNNEIAYMSLAAQVWKEEALSEIAQNAMRKLAGLASPIDISEVPAIAPVLINAPKFLNEIIDCISKRRTIEFVYLDSEMLKQSRQVNVYSYFSFKGNWYFSGLDVLKAEIRTFKCDRIVGDVSAAKGLKAYEIPEDYVSKTETRDSTHELTAQLLVRKGRGSQLRNRASKVVTEEEFDAVDVPYSSESELISLILWHLDDVEVLAPPELRNNVVKSLKNVVMVHG